MNCPNSKTWMPRKNQTRTASYGKKLRKWSTRGRWRPNSSKASPRYVYVVSYNICVYTGVHMHIYTCILLCLYLQVLKQYAICMDTCGQARRFSPSEFTEMIDLTKQLQTQLTRIDCDMFKTERKFRQTFAQKLVMVSAGGREGERGRAQAVSAHIHNRTLPRNTSCMSQIIYTRMQMYTYANSCMLSSFHLTNSRLCPRRRRSAQKTLRPWRLGPRRTSRRS